MLQAAGQSGREIKIVMLGSTTVGKSSLVTRYTRDLFDPDGATTVGAAFLTKAIAVGDTAVKLQIWDTGGSERYRAMAPNYYHSADAAVVIYDVTSVQSYQEVGGWVHELRERAPNIVAVALGGNKSDLGARRAVLAAAGRDFARAHGLQVFLETSALTGENVAELFAQAAGAVLRAQGAGRAPPGAKAGPRRDDPTRKACCA
jgi:Ras-related protein Rab-5C